MSITDTTPLSPETTAIVERYTALYEALEREAEGLRETSRSEVNRWRPLMDKAMAASHVAHYSALIERLRGAKIEEPWQGRLTLGHLFGGYAVVIHSNTLHVTASVTSTVVYDRWQPYNGTPGGYNSASAYVRAIVRNRLIEKREEVLGLSKNKIAAAKKILGEDA